MLKLMWVDGKPMWIPVTEQEDAERVAMLEAVRNLPEIEPEKIADNSGYIGKHAELSVYDAMLAEIYAEHDGSKARVRNRRRADRKHNVLPKVRKQMRYDRGWNRYLSMPCYGCKNIGIAEYRMNNAEQVAREDYKIELRNIADDDERMQIEAEIREYEQKQAVEQANARAWMAMHDWLEWA